MTARKLAVFLLPAVWIVLVVIRVFDGEEPKRQPLKFKSGRVAAAEALNVTGPANVDGSADGDHGMPLTPKNIFAPLGTNPEALQTAAAIVPASRSGDAMARFGKKRAPLVSSRVPLRADVASEDEEVAEATTESGDAEAPLETETITISLSAEFMGPPEPSLEDLLMRVRGKARAEVEEWRRQQERLGVEAKRQAEFAEAQARQQRDLEVQQAKQKREAALQQARQFMAQYRFLGYLEEGDQHQAFLAKGQQLYVVHRGETVDGRLRVKAVDGSSIRLQDAGTNLESTILLSLEGQEGS